MKRLAGRRVRLDQRDRELVAARCARRGPSCARSRRAASGDAAQHAVADRVAARVVDRLEVVEVDDDERQPVPVALGARELAVEVGPERVMVEEPGERVAPCRSASSASRARSRRRRTRRRACRWVVEPPLRTTQQVGARRAASGCARHEAPERRAGAAAARCTTSRGANPSASRLRAWCAADLARAAARPDPARLAGRRRGCRARR